MKRFQHIIIIGGLICSGEAMIVMAFQQYAQM